jgi:hypothetical protein
MSNGICSRRSSQRALADDMEPWRCIKLLSSFQHRQNKPALAMLSHGLSTHALPRQVCTRFAGTLGDGPTFAMWAEMEGWHDVEVHTYRRVSCNPGRMR